MKNFFNTLYILFLIGFCYVANDIYLPSLPALGTYFQATDQQVQITLTTFLLSFSLAPLFFGPISDHIGRKKVLLTGLGLAILGTVICLLSPSIQFFIAARFIQGIGTGGILIAARATVSDLYVGKELAKQMSFVTMLMPIVLSAAPTLGGALQQFYGWQASFICVVALFGGLAAWVAYRGETLAHHSQATASQIFSTYLTHLKNRPFRLFATNFILPAFGMFAYIAVSPFLFQEVIGLSPMVYGSLAIYLGATIFCSGFINIKLLNYLSVNQIIAIGSSLMTLAGILLIFFHSIDLITTWSVLVPSLFYFTCMPFCVSNSASKSLSFVKSHFGAASALMTTLQFLAGSFGSFVFTLIPISLLPLGIALLGVGFLSFLNLHFASKEEHALKASRA